MLLAVNEEDLGCVKFGEAEVGVVVLKRAWTLGWEGSGAGGGRACKKLDD